MSEPRSNPKPASRTGGRVKANAAEGGGAPAPALMHPSRPQNHAFGRSGLTTKTVALPLVGEGWGEGAGQLTAASR